MESPFSLPSISDSEPEENDGREKTRIIDGLLRVRRAPLEAERLAMEEGRHPGYLAGLERARQVYERQLEKIRMFEEAETKRIEREFALEMRALEKEQEQRLNELVETLYHEQEERKRTLDAEISSMDIEQLDQFAGHGGTSTHHYLHQQTAGLAAGKKQLRRRPNEGVAAANPSSGVGGVEQPGGGGAAAGAIGGALNDGKRRKKCGSPAVVTGGGGSVAMGGGLATSGAITHLLPERAIAADVNLFAGRGEAADRDGAEFGSAPGASQAAGEGGGDEAAERGGTKRKVSLENGRLNLDGKIFSRYQNVTIRSQNYGEMPATILSITEYVQFRSVIAGDTRQVTATKDDLESGRVSVKKRY